MLRIRLRRVGKKRQPYYRVVVADQPDRRDGHFLETLGSYDPHADPPSLTLDRDKTVEWIRKGAQPSEAVAKILKRAGVTGTDGASAPAPVAAAPSEAAEAEAAPSESDDSGSDTE